MRPLRCAVIGAGVLGAGVAARLAEAGAAVTLLEQDRPGQAATRSSFAWLNANRKTPRTYYDLNHAGMQAWAQFAASAGQPAWYQSSGNLEWAGDAQAHAELAARVRRLTEWGYPAGFLDAAWALELEPALRLPAPAAEVAWFPDEGYLLTEPAVGYLVDLAAGYGARLLTGEPGRVTGFRPLAGQSPEAGGGRAVQTAGDLLQPCRQIDRRTDAGEVEPVAAADIAVQDFADMEGDAETKLLDGFAVRVLQRVNAGAGFARGFQHAAAHLRNITVAVGDRKHRQ